MRPQKKTDKSPNADKQDARNNVTGKSEQACKAKWLCELQKLTQSIRNIRLSLYRDIDSLLQSNVNSDVALDV